MNIWKNRRFCLDILFSLLFTRELTEQLLQLTSEKNEWWDEQRDALLRQKSEPHFFDVTKEQLMQLLKRR